jgi:non-canonical purine NTP pyrophosphatase (RdgB/HAM1 family)
MDLVFITGNQHKADYLAENLGIAVRHQKLDLEEIQSLDLHAVVKHKAHSAYAIVGSPVLVEDISLTLRAMNGLPGPLIKWFLAALGNAGVAELAGRLNTQDATVSIMYGLYDGQELHTFEAHTDGHIADEPRGELGFGFQDIFIPGDAAQTFAEMTPEEMQPYYHRLRAVNKLRDYLQSLTLA